MTIVGCVEHGPSPGEFVVVGRALNDAVSTATGSSGSFVPSTTTLRGGDGDRAITAGGTREDWASRLTPKLVAKDDRPVREALGRRVLVTGEYVPAHLSEPLDQLRVTSIQTVAASCVGQ